MQLHSLIIGEGQPFIILHGYLGMGDNWKTHATNLSKIGYQVHLVDQRNHGKSFHSEEFNYAILAEDLKNYINQHKLEQPIILGHSMGGKTAMTFATSYPKLIKKLIVVDIAPKAYEEHHNAILKALSSVNFDTETTRKMVDNKLAELIPDIGVRGFLGKSLYWVEKGRLGYRFNLEVLTTNYPEVLKGLNQEAIFKKPTLFLKGEKSEYIIDNDALLINKQFPDNKIITIKDSGHWVHAQNPKEFYQELVNFIQ